MEKKEKIINSTIYNNRIVIGIIIIFSGIILEIGIAFLSKLLK
jgi:hypothetical protein